MRTQVRVSPQVEDFVKAQAPEPRRRLTRAIKALQRDQGNIRPLEGRLAAYSRLRVGGYRVIVASNVERGIRNIDCIFAERRSVIYDLLEKLLAEESAT